MENLTHTLTGLAISHAGLNRKTRFATLAALVGANLPDSDLVTRLDGTATYLAQHRGITHSLVGVIVLAALITGLIYVWGRRAAPKKSAPPLDARWLFATSLLATASHLLHDFTNAYGVRPFLPFSGRWYAWDIMFIVDPVLVGLLLAGFGVPGLLRLISEEVGARKPSYRRGAILALTAMVALWGVRDLAHRRVVRLLDSHTYGREAPLRMGAFPLPANPFEWVGVVETDSGFHVLEANALDDDVDADRTRVFHKTEASPPLDAATRTRTAGIFLDFARFPWARVSPASDGFEVAFQDLRFASLRSEQRGFVVSVELDVGLRVLSESFRFSGEPRREDVQRPPEGASGDAD